MQLLYMQAMCLCFCVVRKFNHIVIGEIRIQISGKITCGNKSST
jgi:hypothetical protein